MRNTLTSKSFKVLPKMKEEHLDLVQERIRLIWVYKSYGLSMNVLRVICDYLLAPRTLVRFRNNQIRYFEVNQQKWKSLCILSTNLSKKYSLCYTMTMCFDETFVICGGFCKKSAAHIIEKGKVKALPNLSHGRYSHGAIYISLCNKVYVFGGADVGSIEYCENLNLRSREWQEVASMHERRANINPLLYGHLVYIVGGGVEPTLETYDWRRDCFRLLSLPTTSSATYFLSVITGDSLLCISERYNYRVNLKTGQISERFVHEEFRVISSVSMVKLDNAVLFADEHKCTLYSLKDGMIVKIIEDT